MIFQQLGQLVRWSWGYHVLLAPKDKYEEYANEAVEEGRSYGEAGYSGRRRVARSDRRPRAAGEEDGEDEQRPRHHHRHFTHSSDSDAYEPAGRTPVAGTSQASPNDSDDEEFDGLGKPSSGGKNLSSDGDHPYLATGDAAFEGIYTFPRIRNNDDAETAPGIKGLGTRTWRLVRRESARVSHGIEDRGRRTYNALPPGVQTVVDALHAVWLKVYSFLWEFMNPPLWAMLIAVLVASIPSLQKLFFQEGSFIKNSVTSAVSSSAGVAVPLILVVLGANLARNTQKRGSDADPEEREIGKKLLVASLISRMLLPTIIMAPILALIAKYVPVSILDDPIFVIVCFLLQGRRAPCSWRRFARSTTCTRTS